MTFSENRMGPWLLAGLLSLVLLALTAPAQGGGGPRNVLVVANEDSPESLEIASYYLRAREIPAVNLCRITASTNLTVSQSHYQSSIREPIRACIAASPYADRIDYLVLTRGLPIRVNIPDVGSRNTTPTSLTALLQVMDTDLDDAQQGFDGEFLGRPNRYRNAGEFFSHSKDFGDGRNLYLATMLSGFWSEHAKALVDRSLASDGNPPTSDGGVFVLEEGRGAAGVRNDQMPNAVSRLQARGYAAIHIAQSDPEVEGDTIASHVTSGVYSDNSRPAIASNAWPPGALVDVLESFGLVPNNFSEDGSYSQVPVTFWVAHGATGGHGTVFEPYNVAFPDAFMLEPYVDGFNLAETYYQGIPYLYWMNLVLGDPLAAPYAEPPVVSVDSPAPDEVVSGTVQVRVSATTPAPEGIAQIEVFAGDALLGSVAGDAGQVPWDTTGFPDGPARLEAVAYENTAVYTQSTAGIEVVVDNAALFASIVDPLPGTRLAAQTFPVTVEAAAAVTDVELHSEGRVLGAGSGGAPFVIDADLSLLGRGTHTLYAHGTTAGGEEVVSPGIDLLVEVAPEVAVLGGAPAIDPAEGPVSGGTLVEIRGFGFEPGIRVLFAGIEAPQTIVRDGNLLETESPPGSEGLAEVRLENPLGGAAVVPDGFTYLAEPCAATAAVAGLAVAREANDPRLLLSWEVLSDPCLALYRVYAVADPVVAPGFPGEFTDLTDLDEDGSPGSDASALLPPPADTRLWLLQVVAEGTDDSLGPR